MPEYYKLPYKDIIIMVGFENKWTAIMNIITNILWGNLF